MNIILAAIGGGAVLLGALLVIFPTRSASVERAVSSKWIRGTIPQMWQGRDAARSRFAGVAFIVLGGTLLTVGLLMPTHPHA
jgi:hypothetical protein